MKFKGRNGGMALAIRNHIMMFRAFVITLLITLVPTIIFICIKNPYFWAFLILPLMLLAISYIVFSFQNTMIGCFWAIKRRIIYLKSRTTPFLKTVRKLNWLNPSKYIVTRIFCIWKHHTLCSLSKIQILYRETEIIFWFGQNLAIYVYYADINRQQEITHLFTVLTPLYAPFSRS